MAISLEAQESVWLKRYLDYLLGGPNRTVQ